MYYIYHIYYIYCTTCTTYTTYTTYTSYIKNPPLKGGEGVAALPPLIPSTLDILLMHCTMIYKQLHNIQYNVLYYMRYIAIYSRRQHNCIRAARNS